MFPEPFLKSEVTHAALDRLAAKRDLVIYCGAGVTRDRTGVGWGQLVSEVFESIRKRRGRNHSVDAGIGSILSRATIDPSQKASVAVQAGMKAGQTETQFLAPVLHKVLYKDHGWSQGNLLSNVADLAIFTAVFGDDVSLITTNYDDYIDREIDGYIESYFATADYDEKIPGLVVNVIGHPHCRKVLRAPQNAAGTIYVHYIHGRVDSDGKADGDVVFSESSYSTTRARTVNFLYSQFHNATAFLMIGASLNDPPLVEALFRADTEGGWSAHSPVKVALLTPGEGDAKEQAAWLDFAHLRGQHLGVEMLTADSYGQVAQFVEELSLCKLLHSQHSLAEYPDRVSYPVRLKAWWESWNGSQWSSKYDEHHQILRDTLVDIEAYFTGLGWLGEHEVLRLETWVRLDPSVASDRRHLTQYANSTGPLYVARALRKERIESPSTVASVRAFTAGKPLLLGLEELTRDAEASRWKTFFSVPVYYDLEVDFDGFSLVGGVPAGVVTLTSTYPKTKERLRDAACFSAVNMKLSHYQHLLATLEDVGVLLISPSLDQ